MRKTIIVFSILLLAACGKPLTDNLNLTEQTDADPALATQSDLTYIGGFRIPQGTYGDSRAGYSDGIMALGPNRDSIFLLGHSHHQAIAEFSIPPLVNSTDLADFQLATNIQPYSKVLGRTPTGNTQNINRIGGMTVVDNNLLVNVYEYYDANTDVSHTTLVLHSPDNLADSTVSGYHGYDARAHAAMWLSPIPTEWQEPFQGSYITGASSGIPIIGRTTVGPSAFAFYPENTIAMPQDPTTVETKTLLDYSLQNRIGDVDLSNTSLTNDLWTHLTKAGYGFVIPGTRSYMVIGGSGGHDSGVGYKITQDNGKLCGGYCSYEAADNYPYYWIFDLDELAKVASGEILRHDIMPYEYGKFNVPVNASGRKKISGGAYDEESGILYLVVEDGDRPGMEPIPLIVAYQVKQF